MCDATLVSKKLSQSFSFLLFHLFSFFLETWKISRTIDATVRYSSNPLWIKKAYKTKHENFRTFTAGNWLWIQSCIFCSHQIVNSKHWTWKRGVLKNAINRLEALYMRPHMKLRATWTHAGMKIWEKSLLYMRHDINLIWNFPPTSCIFPATWRKYLSRKTKDIWFRIVLLWEKCV